MEMTVDQAIETAKAECKNAYAQAYLKAMDQAVVEGGDKGKKVQILYVLNNMSGWRGATARAVKKVMKTYATS